MKKYKVEVKFAFTEFLEIEVSDIEANNDWRNYENIARHKALTEIGAMDHWQDSIENTADYIQVGKPILIENKFRDIR